MNLPPAARTNIETTTVNQTPTPEPDPVPQRVRAVRTSDLSMQDDALLREPWTGCVMDIEDSERRRRFFERRLTNTRISDTAYAHGSGSIRRWHPLPRRR